MNVFFRYAKRSLQVLALVLCSASVYAAVEVCAPPSCVIPTTISGPIQNDVMMGFYLVLGTVTALLFCNGVCWYFGFFPSRPMPFQIAADPNARAFWREQQKILKAATLKWKTEPELINKRKQWGINALMISSVLGVSGWAVENANNPNPSQRFYALEQFVNLEKTLPSKVFFAKDGALKSNEGVLLGHWSARGDRVLAEMNGETKSTCWFWSADNREMWAFSEACPLPGSHEFLHPVARMRLLPTVNEKLLKSQG